MMILYSRAGCHLCECAEQALQEVGISYTLRLVDEQQDWRDRYGDDVPVLCRDDQLLLKGVINQTRLRLLKVQLLKSSDWKKPPEQIQ